MADLSVVKTLAVIIIAVSMMTIMGVVVLDNMRISTAVLEYQTTSVDNYSVANSSTITLTHGLINAASFVIWNGTADAVSVPTANYTLTCAALDRKVSVDGTPCTVTVVNDTIHASEQWVLPANVNVEYTYEDALVTAAQGAHGYVDSTSGISALGNVGSFLPIVALVVIAGLIIVIVGRSFSKNEI